MLHTPVPEGESPRLGSEVRLSAESTFIKACEQLGDLMTDNQRWGFDFQLDIEKDYREAIALNREYLQAQKKHAQEMASPHFRVQPQLLKLTTGDWMAILGSIDNIDNSVVGVGKCPQEALEAFDKMFSGEIPDSVQQFLDKHTYETNEEPKMDPGTNQPTENPPRTGEDDPGDSPSVEA